MALITPTVTQTTPAITVTTNSAGLTYGSIRQSLGDFVYHAFQLYLASQNIAQLKIVYAYYKYDASGDAHSHVLTPVISPYQYRNTIFYEMRDRPVIIDGRNSINFTMLANTSMQFKLYSMQTSVGQMLDASNFPVGNNFMQLESATGIHGFFEEFKKYIPMVDPEGQKLETSNMNFTITNTTNGNIDMSFLGNFGNSMDISNQTTQYAFNVNSVAVLPTYHQVTITYRQANNVGAPIFTSSATVGNATIQSIVDALNSLGLSQFFMQVIGPNTFIDTYNDKTEFLSMTVT